jgi:hypothetical protein
MVQFYSGTVKQSGIRSATAIATDVIDVTHVTDITEVTDVAHVHRLH